MAMISAAATPATVVPGKRGGRRVVCHGTFISMHKGAGWIKPIEAVDHPSASWNQGDVYLSEKDVLPGVMLEAGDSVVFHLYVDAKGLGAQNCVQVWHEKAQSMRAARDATEISLASAAFLPSAQDVAMATTFLAAASAASGASALQAPQVTPPPGLTPSNVALDLSSFYDDNAEDDDDDDDDESVADDTNVIKISLADALPPEELREPPSKGSVLHAEGNCKRCSFFPKGTCTNGADCEFCHFDHDKRPQNHKRKRLWRERQREKAQLARAEAARVAASLRTPLQEPMKINSCFMNLPKDLQPSTPTDEGSRTPATSTDEGSADEGEAPSTPKSSADEGNTELSYQGSDTDSPLVVLREPCLSGGALKPPSGRKPPMPSFPPPPMPEFLSAVSDRVQQEIKR